MRLHPSTARAVMRLFDLEACRTMARHAAHPPLNPYITIPFLDDARRNLTLLRQTYGARSARYRTLLVQYRTVADDLGCRPAFEEALRSLRNVPNPSATDEG